ncbi:peptidase S10, serine carboxypeptidase, Alpha/Beta hydrolase fold protein [Artemisia annua]|uniref:Peptidase S10, serine carboxypeptidase, Alpha/Beta hydrolase fold protein n=1 Tax=Artemisia annua TaxID=35608 RepID=A0A2U1M4Y2_ARTAN|nr:peptidase S10, serine carboxypeptidase, Alpha/Beta hydrolase fold protein [Artemisia annua]
MGVDGSNLGEEGLFLTAPKPPFIMILSLLVNILGVKSPNVEALKTRIFNCFGYQFCLHFEACLGTSLVYMAFLRFVGDENDANKFSYNHGVDTNFIKPHLFWSGNTQYRDFTVNVLGVKSPNVEALKVEVATEYVVLLVQGLEKQNTSSLLTMSTLFLVFIVLLRSSTLIASQTIVKTLPGYPGPLPFKLETGYVGVGANESVQLFYYFVESEGNPEEDPLIIWLAGGPGCSTLRAFFYEIANWLISSSQFKKFPKICAPFENVPYAGIGFAPPPGLPWRSTLLLIVNTKALSGWRLETPFTQNMMHFITCIRNICKRDKVFVGLKLCCLLFAVGPMRIQYEKYMDNVPALALEPNSWTKVANVIYLDAPTLTGFSYTTDSESVRSSDTASAFQTAEFLRKFVRDHPKFLKNPTYVTGISYSGTVIPIITEELYKGTRFDFLNIFSVDRSRASSLYLIHLFICSSQKGYIGGNPLTDKAGDINSRFEYAYRLALISAELYEATRQDCNGDYAEADSNNLRCMLDINEVNKRVGPINIRQILDPNCDPATNLVRGGNPVTMGNRRALHADAIKMLPARSTLKDTFCRNDKYNYATLWANDENVMKALGVRKGTVNEWLPCNLDMKYNYGKPSMPQYEFNVKSSVAYHERLTKRNCRALIFSGDHDMMVPHVGTHIWINSLNLTITTDNWATWYVNGQAAGYKTTYARDNYTLAFATVKGAGHTAPEFNPAECFELVKRWFANRPI